MKNKLLDIHFIILTIILVALGYLNFQASIHDIDISKIELNKSKNFNFKQDELENTNYKLASLDGFSEITDRPLFDNLRKKRLKKVKDKASQKPFSRPQTQRVSSTPIHQIKLLGVLVSKTKKQALIKTDKNQKGIWLDIASEFEGWKMINITNNNVILQNRNNKKIVNLYKK